MYIPKYHRVLDPKIIADFLRQNNFATLVSCENGLPVATHLPLEFVQAESGEQFLYGHVARANAQWRNFNSKIAMRKTLPMSLPSCAKARVPMRRKWRRRWCAFSLCCSQRRFEARFWRYVKQKLKNRPRNSTPTESKKIFRGSSISVGEKLVWDD
jgi:hypothetical protein